MTRKSVPPSIKETAFDCPYCGAYTTQTWFRITVTHFDKAAGPPKIGNKESLMQLRLAKDISEEEKMLFEGHLLKLLSKDIFVKRIAGSGHTVYSEAHNLNLSGCYHCGKFAVWVHDRLLFPPERHGAHPNADLPEDVLHDYEEARSILDLSPRGAAALLRLSIQKLCSHLGEKGKNIDDDIASLVAKGLNPLVQKSLDVVRVIGNEAVHPGVMDLKDDRDTATTLFGLVNAIADQMITHPKTVDAMYKKLPEGKRAAIEKRDTKAIVKPNK